MAGLDGLSNPPVAEVLRNRCLVPEHERELVACAVLDPDVSLMADVAPADFHDSELGDIWAAVQQVALRDGYPDHLVISDELERMGRTVSPMLLVELATTQVVPSNALLLAPKVRDAAVRRRALANLELAASSILSANGSWQQDTGEHLASAQKIIAPPPEPVVRPEPDLSSCPPLPDTARLDPALTAGASPWLDAYVDFSRTWSPQSWDGYHVNVALGILATVAARRICFDFGGSRYPSLMLADVGRSSIWAKSTAQKVGRRVLSAAGLDFLLAADTTTPQALVARMAVREVTDWDAVPPERRDVAKLRLAFAAQRGWLADEFGTHIAGMMRSDGPLADFIGLLRVLDDGLDHYESDTIARGSAYIDRPYLALLVNFTPADVAKYAGSGGGLWLNGFWARFVFACPPPEAHGNNARFPDGACVPPASLVAALRDWHERLGVPAVEITERPDKDGKPLTPRAWETRISRREPEPCTFGLGVWDAVYRYRDGLRSLIDEDRTPTDLDANYSRLPEQALRVCALFASLENGGRMELRHWAKSQEIAEMWRQGVHSLHATVNMRLNEAEQLEDKLLDVYRRHGSMTAAEAKKYVRGLSIGKAIEISDSLARAGVLTAEVTRKGTSRYMPVESETK